MFGYTVPHFLFIYRYLLLYDNNNINDNIIIMSLFIKLFDTTAEYNTYTADTSNFILPNVSLTVDNNTVHYNPIDPYNGHDYVEIGGLKWATMNIGANSVTDTGLYFQWGDTQGYTADQVRNGEKYFGWADYKYGNGTSSPSATGMTKYNSSDGKTVLEADDDAAVTNWGGSWRMPTIEEYAALGNAVNTAWTTNYLESGAAGMICTDKTDSSKVLFFPACGYCLDGSVYNVGSYGYYWSSLLYSNDVQRAYYLRFLNGLVNWQLNDERYNGFLIRGVVG